MLWKYLSDGTRMIVEVLDDLLFEQLPWAFEKYITQLPLWSITLTLIGVTATVVYVTLGPTRRGDMSNVGSVMLVNAVAKASRGLFTIGFYGSIFMIFAILVMRNA